MIEDGTVMRGALTTNRRYLPDVLDTTLIASPCFGCQARPRSAVSSLNSRSAVTHWSFPSSRFTLPPKSLHTSSPRLLRGWSRPTRNHTSEPSRKQGSTPAALYPARAASGTSASDGNTDTALLIISQNKQCRGCSLTSVQSLGSVMSRTTLRACTYMCRGTRSDYPTGDEEGELLEEKRRPVIASRNIFYCGLRGLSGPDRFVFIASVLLTALPIAAFFLFEGPWMWSWFSPAVPIIEAWLYLTCLALHLVCAFSDPGIIPRKAEDKDASPFRQQPMSRTVTLKGEKTQLKFCTTCNVTRPPRAIHCGVCDNCVDRFDHHCPWTGNCVGRRNYRTFLWMVTMFVIMDVYTCFLLVAKLIILSLNSPNSGPAAFWEAVTVDPAAPILILYILIFIVFQGMLLLYHLKLCWINETTNENKKGIFRGKVNPHRLPGISGGFRNVFRKFCGVSVARYVKFHKLLDWEDEEEWARASDPHFIVPEAPETTVMTSFKLNSKDRQLTTEMYEI